MNKTANAYLFLALYYLFRKTKKKYLKHLLFPIKIYIFTKVQMRCSYNGLVYQPSKLGVRVRFPYTAPST